ncbi:MAG: ribosome silencing factor [Bacteroidetes bacterium]|nr:ribosome silencing factor [Bacteroidota bacterium]
MREVKAKAVSYDNSTALSEYLIELIQDKKGRSIKSLDLRAIPEAIADYFIVCHGDSNTQVRAIIDNIHKKAKEDRGELPHHVEGTASAEWAIIDYTDVVVHVFQKEMRDHYQLEDLWSDAVVTELDDNY